MNNPKLRRAILAACALPVSLTALGVSAPAAFAAQEPIEEVIVTGSFIRGSPEDAASPVDVLSREEMNLTGNPSVLEMIRNLGPSSGIDGETNQFTSNGLEGISNVNLRGLGPGRTLVLMNGRRLVSSPYAVAETGQLFVNTNQIPAIALERLELLKDGASATYGSDAVAGVVNFITRSGFRGVELQGSFTEIDDSDGDIDAGVILGFGNDSTDFVISGGWQERSKVEARDVGWALSDSPAVNPRGGFSGIPNPSRFLPLTGAVDDRGSPVFNDPDCTTVGGHLAPNGDCNFRFSDFDNIAEDEEHYQIFAEVTHDFGNGWEAKGEALFSHDEVPEWNTSPSYPPQSLFSTDRYVGPGMPHFDDFIARNPDLATDFAAGALVLGRTFGVSGQPDNGGPQEGSREYDTYRIAGGLTGEFDNGVIMDASLTYGTSEGTRTTNDTRIDRLAFAYRGLGGPDCDPSAGTPGSGNLGAGDCFYYNPFTSGYPFSNSATAQGVPAPGGDDPSLHNTQELFDWLVQGVGTEVTTELFVAELVFSGESGVQAGGGNVGWAAGAQYRREDFEVDPNTVTDLTQTPCPFGLDNGETYAQGNTDNPVALPFSYSCSDPGTGAFHFLAGTLPFETDIDVYSVFGEVQIPLYDTLDVQVAARFEDYGGEVGSTMDPKIALRWQATDTLTVRSSMGSSFRAPGLNQLDGRGTSLQFVPPTNAFKAVDTTGNPDLSPEESINFNFGLIWEPTANVFATLDYWNFDFSDPIVIEPASDIVTAAFNPDADASLREFARGKLTFQDPANPTPASVQRVDVTYINGPDIQTDGIDYAVTWDLPTDGRGMFTVGVKGTYINSYEVAESLFVPEFDAEGQLNRLTYVRPLPQLKNNAYVNWAMGQHNLRADWYYTSSYDDDDLPAGVEDEIDAFNTLDLSYNFRFLEDQARLFVSVYNLTDEDPPFSSHELAYDPYTHNPYGRMIKMGATWYFDPM
jgi:outer membrane receptor protein involved in Fe transport